jgi:hypothetical protein
MSRVIILSDDLSLGITHLFAKDLAPAIDNQRLVGPGLLVTRADNDVGNKEKKTEDG